MKLVITKNYPPGDSDFTEDAEDETLTVDGRVALTGDWYHNHIDAKIDGFVEALKFLGLKYELEEIEQESV